jgi:methylated-DNA-[protein]-cysteine S-methyltransferase
MSRDITYWHEAETPIGPLLLAGDGERLKIVHFQSGRWRRSPATDWRADVEPFRPVLSQLAEYFAGTRRDFDVALAFAGTEFQLSVWQALRLIPYGTTISYGELARRIGKDTRASRAVGLANGANPLPIIVPCHRVIGSDGSLTGFGGGIEMKRKLLALEGAACVGGETRDLWS